MKKLKVNILDVPENSQNEVTSHKVFQNRRVRNKDGTFAFHPDGIFSNRIFGRFNKCSCGLRTSVGICDVCDTRVLSKSALPIFYIKLEDTDFLRSFVDKNDLKIEYSREKVQDRKHKETTLTQVVNNTISLLSYDSFVYINDGEVSWYSINFKEMDLTVFDETKVKIGREAALLYVKEYINSELEDSFFDKWLTNKLVIPHTSMRKIQGDSKDNYVLGYLNTLYVDLLKLKNKLSGFKELGVTDIFLELSSKQILNEKIKNIQEEIISIITQGKNSIVSKELRGQSLVGNIRAVMINNYSVGEDEIHIGKVFIPTLYPTISKLFLEEDGSYDIDNLNKYLRENEYYVIANRQPSIGAKSIIGAIPIFSKDEKAKYVVQINPIILDGIAGDCDGDVLSIIALYSREANEDAKKLITSKNYIEGSDGSIRQAYPEDFEYVKQRLEREKRNYLK